MKTIPYLLLLLPVFLLTGLIGSAQENNNSKTVVLHLSDNTDLVHFKEGNYVLSFHRADLLKLFTNDDWVAACIGILTAGDTLDFVSVSEQMLKSSGALPGFLFEQAFDQHMKAGNVRIFSILTGKDLAHVRYTEITSPQFGIQHLWLLEDPFNDAPIYGIRSSRKIAMHNF